MVRAAGMDWVTYRHGKLGASIEPVHRSWTLREASRVYVRLADEAVDIPGYGPARQVT